MRVSLYTFLGTCLVAATAAQAKDSPFTGHFQGTGRACYGTLSVQAKTISWTTPFSQCTSISYELVERSKQDGQTTITYRFKSHPGSCRYTILALTHHGAADATGWEVTGYGSEKSYRTDKSNAYKARAEDMMSCPLVRDPGN